MMKTENNQVGVSSASNQAILNIAHRGARAFAPENTLPAFAKAKQFGCQMFEMDVRMSKDGQIVVYHDEHLLRCTDAEKKFPGRASYQLADFTYHELEQLDAGTWFVGQLVLPPDDRQAFLKTLTQDEMAEFITAADQDYFASGRVKIPTLMETLALAKHLDLMINVELKSPVEPAATFVDGVVASIMQMNMESRILISSFDHGLLREVRQRTRNIMTAALSDGLLKAPVTYLRKLKASDYNLNQYYDFQNDRFDSPAGRRYLTHLGKLRKAGFGVNIWTCNDAEEIAYLLKAGVTGIISDYPNRVKEQIDAFLPKNRANTTI